MSESWRTDGFLATWRYGLQLPATGEARDRAAWIATLTERLLGAIRGFARPVRAAVSSRSLGEDNLVVDPLDDASVSLLSDGLREIDDVVLVDVDLTPVARDATGRPFEIPCGAELMIDCALDDEGLPLSTLRLPFRLDFSLHVDVYAHKTPTLGSINAPLLRAFLERLEELPVEFVGVDAERYPNAHRYGLD